MAQISKWQRERNQADIRHVEQVKAECRANPSHENKSRYVAACRMVSPAISPDPSLTPAGYRPDGHDVVQ